MISKIPNTLSILRIFFIPFIIYGFIGEYFFLSLILSILVCVTDILDGYIARKYNYITQIGFYLDALADKTFILSLYIVMGVKLLLPFYLVVIVVFKDLFIFGMYFISFLLKFELKLKTTKLSKLNTVFQMLLILIILTIKINESLNTDIVTEYVEIFCFVVAFTTISSLILYIFKWFN